MKKKLIYLIFSIASLNGAYSQVGALDATFGANGITITDIFPSVSDDTGKAMALQPDGKVVVAGVVIVNQVSYLSVCRYNTNGILDNSFSGDGIETTTLNMQPGNSVNDVVIQPDGCIIIGGRMQDDFGMIRYTSNGTIDNTFGVNGFVFTSLSINAESAAALKLQNDGKIVLAGHTVLIQNQSFDFAVLRYNSNGTLDNAFGTNGIVITNINYTDVISSMAIQNDGKIIVAGYTLPQSAPFFRRFAVARYNTNGTLDGAFGAAGIATVSPVSGSIHNHAYALAIQPDGKIVLGGVSYSGVNSDFSLARFDANGILDNTFGINGVNVCTTTQYDKISSVVIQPNGNIIASGTNGNCTLLKYTPAGILDNSFGVNGILTHTVGATSSEITASMLQPDGKLITTGRAASFPVPADMLLTRYNVDCNNLVAAPTAISGNTLVCQGNQETYTTLPVSNASSYAWTVYTGTGSSTTNSITVTALQSGVIGVAATNSCSASSITYLQVNVTTCTRLNMHDTELKIDMYPNPCNGNIFIDTKATADFSYTIFNTLGTLVATGNFTEKTNLDLKHLSKGFYTISFAKNNSNIVTKSIIITE